MKKGGREYPHLAVAKLLIFSELDKLLVRYFCGKKKKNSNKKQLTYDYLRKM